MRTPAGFVVLVTLFGTLAPVPTSVTSARVTCVRGALSVETEWAEDSLIVEGTVVSDAEEMGADGFLDRTIYDVRVDRSYRGAMSNVAVYSENDSGRFPMRRGEHYLLFLSRWEDGHYHVDACGSSRPLARGGDVTRPAAVVGVRVRQSRDRRRERRSENFLPATVSRQPIVGRRRRSCAPAPSRPSSPTSS